MVRLMFLYLLLEVSIENEKTDTLTLQHQAQLCLPVLPKLSIKASSSEIAGTLRIAVAVGFRRSMWQLLADDFQLPVFDPSKSANDRHGCKFLEPAGEGRVGGLFLEMSFGVPPRCGRCLREYSVVVLKVRSEECPERCLELCAFPKPEGILNSTMEPGSSFFKSSWV